MKPAKPLLLLLLGCSALAGAGPVRKPAEIDSHYEGSYKPDFRDQMDSVRLLLGHVPVEVSARLGLLQYEQGFRYPLTIRFADSAPIGIENVLAYVRLSEDDDGRFQQELVVNLGATRRRPAQFDRVFTHEMTHVVLNDAVGGEASLKIPHWVQEGLAQYVTDEGEERLKNAVRSVGQAEAGRLLCDLDGPYNARAYSQYYLAIKFMYERYSSNAVQAFVRNLIAGQTTDAALEDATGSSWKRFQEDLRDYSLETLRRL